MGLRFRKSVKIAPGVRVNFGKKGSSLSVGGVVQRLTSAKRNKNNSGIPVQDYLTASIKGITPALNRSHRVVVSSLSPLSSYYWR